MTRDVRELLATVSAPSDVETLRILVIGSREGVIETIHTLHILNFAAIGDWSALLPAPAPHEVMSILTKHRP